MSSSTTQPPDDLPVAQTPPQTPRSFIALLRTISDAFASSDPLLRYLVSQEFHLKNTEPMTQEMMSHHIRPTIQSSVNHPTLILEAGNFQATAIWFTPDAPRPPRDLSQAVQGTIDYDRLSQTIKKKAIRDRRFWYLHFLAKAPSSTTPGMVRAVMQPVLDMAKVEGLPCYLEASNKHARDVYMHYGFRVCGEIDIGKGEVDERGFWEENGAGCRSWAMVLEPEDQR